VKTISILIPETAIPAAIVDPSYMFNAVNEFHRGVGLPVPFKVQLVAAKREIFLNQGTISVRPDLLLADVSETDLIIIPALSGDMEAAIALNSDLIPWVVNRYKSGSEVASLCVGAFLLASTGLLNGKSCSTHWMFANQFRQLFPEVTLADDRVIVDQNGIYSSGGAMAYWNLLLYLVEKYTNKEMAIMASKFFLLNVNLNSQSPFSIFKGQKDHGDCVILEAQVYIETHYKNKITVDELAALSNLSRRTFERRFKKATSNSPAEYLQRVKIEAAKSLLESGRKTVNEVMFEVGYADLKAFRDVFKKTAGMSPVDYRKKYNEA
jgi:transcriptional regulator GlxA family with amidase domain